MVLKTLQGISDQIDSQEECPCFFFRINQSGDQVGYTYAELADRISHLSRFFEHEDIMNQVHSIITNMNSLALGSELDGLSEEDRKSVRQSIVEIMKRKSLMKSFSTVEREAWISSSLKKVKLLAYKGYCYTNIKPIERNYFNYWKGNSFDLLQLTGKYQIGDVEEEKNYEAIWKRPCKMVISTKSGITIGALSELELG